MALVRDKDTLQMSPGNFLMGFTVPINAWGESGSFLVTAAGPVADSTMSHVVG